MRGEVLHYDEEQGFGFITGADGNRYTFGREDLLRAMAPGKGTEVEFQANGNQATGIFAIRGDASLVAAAATASDTVQFGRSVAAGTPENTGLWNYFWQGFTSNYVNFRARARRKEYWGFMLFATLAAIALTLAGLVVDGVAGNLDSGDEMPVATMILAGIFVVALIIPGLAITIRRQHDIGLSGWFYLLILIPYIGGLIIFVFTLIPSQKHENRWGAVPAGVRI